MSDAKVGPVQEGTDGVRKWFGAVYWVFPVLMLILSQFVPALSAPITAGVTANLPWWLIGELLLAIGWVGGGFMHVTSGNTSVSALKADSAISNTVQIILLAVFVWSLAKGNLQWGMIIPTVASVLDMYVTGDRAINNAALKPIVHQQTTKN